MSANALGRHPTLRYKDAALERIDDDVVVEEPLEIVIDDFPYAITMRMPGDDLNLVRGFLFTEGVLGHGLEAVSIAHCNGAQGHNRVLVSLRSNGRPRGGFFQQRNEFLSKSSCGVCGKSAIEEIFIDIPPVAPRDNFAFRDVLALKDVFEARKSVFPLAGSTHSAALFDRKRRLLAFAEDVGRHNALDKAIGAVLGARGANMNCPSESDDGAAVALVSSRLSFEMVQKAGRLGVQLLAGVSAPTMLAIRFAEELGITLIGFLRRNRMNVYTHLMRMV